MGMGFAAARHSVGPHEASQTSVERVLKVWIIAIASAGAVYFVALSLFALAAR